MTWDFLVSLVEQFLTLAALIGAVWSAFSFVRGASERREADRVNELKAWRKGAVHKLLHSSRPFLTIDELTSRLRSESFDAKVQVKKEELTSDEVRLLLLEMVQAGTVQQGWGDHFGIKQNDPSSENAERARVTWQVVNDAYRLITLAPGGLSTEKLHNAMFEGSDPIALHTFELMLSQLRATGAASVSPEGKWLPTSQNPQVGTI